MPEIYGSWESDPLFSAAEVVQDSADRMDSAFRMLCHEQNLPQGDPSDSKLLRSMECHKRELAMALETTKWQLEDFEGAVNYAAISDKSNSRKHAIFKHRQFIRAIREQIAQVERSVQDLTKDDFNQDAQLPNANEQDTYGLALFLSGGNSIDGHIRQNSSNNIMGRFLNSTTESEIVEIETEAEPLPMNGLKSSDQGYDSPKNNMSWNTRSPYFKRYDIESSTSSRAPSAQKEREESYETSGANGLEFGGSGSKVYCYSNRLMEFVLGFLRNSQLSSRSRESFTKRRKDGDVTDNLIEADHPMFASSSVNIAPSGKIKYVWVLWTSINRRLQGLNLEGLLSALRFYVDSENIQRKIRSSQHLFANNRVAATLVILIVLGLIVFYFL